MDRKERRRDAREQGHRPHAAPRAALHPLVALATAEHRAGRLPAAENLYRQIIATLPAEAAQAQHRLGILYAQSGRMAQAAEQLSAAARLEPGNPVFLSDAGNAYLAMGRMEDAIGAFRKAIARRPDFADAHFNLGNALSQHGRLDEAVDSFHRALALKPDAAPIHVNLGVTLQRRGDHAEALTALRRALAITPRSFDALYNLGLVLADQGKLDEAAEAYREALAIAPDAPWTNVNYGLVLHRLGRTDEAIACFERAIALAPDLAEAHNNLGIVLREKERFEEAAASCRRAIELNPGYAEAYSNLGNALAGQDRLPEAEAAFRKAIELRPDFYEAYLNLANCFRDRTAEAFRYFMRHAELKYGGATGRPAGHAPVPAPKLKHDLEQLDDMLEAGIAVEDVRRVRAKYTDGPPDRDPLDDFFHIEGGERLPGSTLNPANTRAEIEARWEGSKPNLVVVDDLLTPEALQALRRFCWGSTIWRDQYHDGYLGAFPQDGFACPLMAQIADELRDAYPGIFKRYPLMQTWGFKYDSAMSGIRIHADFAAVNVNFWITPDEANLDPESGGLVVWDAPAPLDWDFEKYNRDGKAMYAFLEQAKATSVTVPHRANRALIFDSDLFHKTDRIVFKEGYRNRRINITLLYGFREKAQ
jgi:tetratricopeptide (TPR) repeat protein